MKYSTRRLKEYLQSEQSFLMADLYAFQLADGTILRYTTFDADVVYNESTYSSKGPIIRRSRIRNVIGVEVDTLNLEVAPHLTDLLLGAPWLHAAGVGALDGSTLTLYRVFLQPDLSVVGGITLFVGQISDLQITRSMARITVNSAVQMLNMKLPHNVWQPGCCHTVYDDGCGIDRTTVGISSEWVIKPYVALLPGLGTTRMKLECTCVSVGKGGFEQGYIQFISGALAGVRRTVKSFNGAFHLLLPLPSIPGEADHFLAYPGCDKTQATCTIKFNNLPNFRGFPYIPVAETAL